MKFTDGILYIQNGESGDLVPIQWKEIILVRKVHGKGVEFYYRTGDRKIHMINDPTASFAELSHRLDICAPGTVYYLDQIMIIPKHRTNDPALETMAIFASAVRGNCPRELIDKGDLQLKYDIKRGRMFLWQIKYGNRTDKNISLDYDGVTLGQKILYDETIKDLDKMRVIDVLISSLGFERAFPYIESGFSCSSDLAYEFLKSGYVTDTLHADAFRRVINHMRKHPSPEFIRCAIEYRSEDQKTIISVPYASRDGHGNGLVKLSPEESQEVAIDVISEAIRSGDIEKRRAVIYKRMFLEKAPWWGLCGFSSKIEEAVKKDGSPLEIAELTGYLPAGSSEISSLLMLALKRNKGNYTYEIVNRILDLGCGSRSYILKDIYVPRVTISDEDDYARRKKLVSGLVKAASEYSHGMTKLWAKTVIYKVLRSPDLMFNEQILKTALQAEMRDTPDIPGLMSAFHWTRYVCRKMETKLLRFLLDHCSQAELRGLAENYRIRSVKRLRVMMLEKLLEEGMFFKAEWLIRRCGYDLPMEE